MLHRILYGLVSLALLLPAPTVLAHSAASGQTESARSFFADLEAAISWWGDRAELEPDSGAADVSGTTKRRRAGWDFDWLRQWTSDGVETPTANEPAPTEPAPMPAPAPPAPTPTEPPAEPPAAPTPAPEPQLPELAARVVELTNLERQKAGLAPLSVNASLAAAAQAYAELLAAGSCFGHQCGPVPNFAQRLQNAGYTDWSSVGENIAGGQDTPAEVVATWMNSPGHRANILSPDFKEIGVGVAEGGRYGIYWVQEFGARR